MENKVKIIHLYDTTAIAKNWHFFATSIKPILLQNNADIGIVYNNLLAGRWMIWTIFIDNKYNGFIIGVEDYINNNKSITIIQIYSKTDTLDINNIMKIFEDLCRQRQYQRIKIYSLAKADSIEQLGYSMNYIEYYKEL